MTVSDEIAKAFGTSNLYEVLGIDKDASHDQIKKAYRRMSLKIHPDRVTEDKKEEFTKKFQTLAQVHYVLSDIERRKMYDDHGIIMNEDSLSSEADWSQYWRLLFPKVSAKDIDTFLKNYQGSQEEKDDLIKLYNRYEGDMDKISQCHIAFDEDRSRELIEEMIVTGKVEAYSKFTDEPESTREKRRKKAAREEKQAEKARMKGENDLGDLTALIRGRQKNSFDAMMANLEAKYANKQNQGKKRKRSDN